jgi:heme exporter protein B
MAPLPPATGQPDAPPEALSGTFPGALRTGTPLASTTAQHAAKPRPHTSTAITRSAKSILFRPAAVLLAKELRTEFRTRELLATTLVFVLMVLVLFSFTFDPTAAETRRFAPGLLWLALLFAGSLMLHPSFTREQPNDTLAALRMAPIEPFAILAAKIAANLCFLLLAEAVLLPIFGALYNLSLLPVIGRLVLVLFLGTLGLATVGTVFSAISSQARMRELLLPLLLLPLMAPALIASAEATVGLFDEAPSLSPVWAMMLAAFDVMFLTVTWLFGEYLLEE